MTYESDTDIVQRLRHDCTWGDILAAADEIERLRYVVRGLRAEIDALQEDITNVTTALIYATGGPS